MLIFHKMQDLFVVGTRFLKATLQVMYGVWRINRLERPRITFFGGHAMSQDDVYARQARVLAARLVESDFSVITGGGPGIMQAANCGALVERIGSPKTLGITVKGINGIGVDGERNIPEEVNPCTHELLVTVDYFFVRKWLLINYVQGFVIFPGGVGTLDELAEILVLIQTGKLRPVPIVLVGKTFWQPLVDWALLLRDQQFIHADLLSYVTIVDDSEHVLEILKSQCGDGSR